MKVLAIVEVENGRIISQEPERVFMENADHEKVKQFFENTRKLRKETRTISSINEAQKIRLLANFDEIKDMGFVHISELDRIMEKKVKEVYHAVGAEFYYDYYVKRPFKKFGYWFTKKIGFITIKHALKK